MELCLSEKQLDDFAAGKLPAKESAAVEAHLDQCQACFALAARTVSLLLRSKHGETAAPEAPMEVAPRARAATPRRFEPGQTAGRYRIVSLLGAGGMGAVYLAEDPALERKVAIKVLKSRSASAAANALRVRLLREAHAMARLQHANVVTVFDVGLFGPEIFVVMEHVDGTTLRPWLAAAPRSLDQILDVFVQAARGLEAAHAAGLLHRDFKPDNLLISDGRARVSDFGLASPLDPQHPDRDSAGELAGTPAYMSPEQLAGEEAGVAADIFSFGVTLFEAVHGVRPFVGSTFLRLRDNISQGRIEPGMRRRLPRWLADLLKRTLDTNPARRPLTMRDVVARIEHGRGRRRGWAWLTVAAAVLAAVAVVGGGIVRTRLACRGAERKLAGIWDRPRQETIQAAFRAAKSPLADETFAVVKTTLDGWAHAWVAAHQSACEATVVHREQSAELLDLRMTCLNQHLDELRAFTDLLASADSPVVAKAIDGAGGLERVESCSDVAALTALVPPPRDPATRARLATVRTRISDARAQRLAGRFALASTSAADAVAQARALDYSPVEAEACFVSGQIATEQGHFKDADQLLQSAGEAADRGRDDRMRAQAACELVWVAGVKEERFADGRRWAHTAATILARVGHAESEEAALAMNLGLLAQSEGKFDDAERELTRALTLRQRVSPADAREVGATLVNLGSVLEDKGQYDDAVKAYQRALDQLRPILGARHPYVATVIDDLGSALLAQNHAREALDLYQRALTIREAALDGDHPQIAASLINIGSAANSIGDDERSLQAFERARPIAQKAGPDLEATVDLDEALTMQSMGRMERAIELGKKALELRQRAFGPVHPAVGKAALTVAVLLLNSDHWVQAQPYFVQARAILEPALGADHDLLGDVHEGLARCLERQGKPRDAMNEYERSLAIRRQVQGDTNVALAPSLCGIGRAALATGDTVRAVKVLEQARTLLVSPDATDSDRADADFPLARALWAAGKERARARQLAAHSLAAYEAGGPVHHGDAADVRAWLRAR